MAIPGQRNSWWLPAKQREAQRQLERQASQLLRADRARQRPREAAPKPNTAAPEPASRGWVKLGDLRAVLRKSKKAEAGICVRKI